MITKKKIRHRQSRCKFCTKEGCPRPAFVDYKDALLRKLAVSSHSKMYGRKRTNLCAPFQRAMSNAVKRARFMSLISYAGDQ